MPPTRSELESWDRDHVWHPFTPMAEYAAEPPIILVEGEGCFLVDLDGKRYLDATASMWCNVHGHHVPALDDAIRRQLERVAHTTLLGLANVPSIELARKLATLAPPGLTRVFFSDDGATAVEVALKMAFQYWQQRPGPRPRKTRFLSLQLAYHGDTLGDVSVGDLGRFHYLFRPLLFDAVRAPSPHCYRCPLGLNRATCQVDCAGELERLVRQHADTLAAVVVEPLVQAAAGMIVAPAGYLRRVREITRACGVLLIADEVAVGIGRTGTLFACAHEGVVPDFLCLAKGLTGGYLPLAATLTTDEVYAAFLGRAEEGRTFYHGHTYTGNPLGAAVALANLELIETSGLLHALPAKIERLAEHLRRLAKLPIVGDVRQCGLLAGVELVADQTTRTPASFRLAQQVCRLARARGVLIRPLGHVVALVPPLAIDLPTLDFLGKVVYDCVRDVAGAA
jgi:adenosylmethionine-8-amino-7-oxononanoate aminotransferase